MTMERRNTILLTVAGWVLSGVLQGVSFAYFFGRLTQSVEDQGKRLDKIERKIEGVK